LVKLFKGNLKEISQFFEGNFGQNKEKKRIFWFFKVEALVGLATFQAIYEENSKLERQRLKR
jgi:hypothetical protein